MWERCCFKNLRLSAVHRQRDPLYTDLLARIRTGQGLTTEQSRALYNRVTNIVPDDAIQLISHTDKVAAINDAHMEALKIPKLEYESLDYFDRQPHHQDDYPIGKTMQHGLQNHRYEKKLTLRLGMRVILLCNLELQAGLANGSQGEIVDWMPANDYDPRSRNPKYASQRYREEQARLFKDELKRENRFWPIVKFNNGAKRAIEPHCCVTEIGTTEPYSRLSRTQIPLIAGWAITVHKSQGMTLDKVVVDLEDCWSTGMAYVAVSRCTTLEQMYMRSRPNFMNLDVDPNVECFIEKHDMGR